MKNFYSKLLLPILFLLISNIAYAQYSASDLESGKQNAALARDASGNIFTTRAKTGGGYEIVKYTNGSGTAVAIYDNIAGDANDIPYGLAIASNGDIYFSSDMKNSNGKITRLVAPSYTTSTVVQSGRYFTGLAFDNQNRLYALEYTESSNKYSLVRYNNPATQVATNTITPGLLLYTGINVNPGLTYPTGVSVVADGATIYINLPFNWYGSNPETGGIVKLTAPPSGNDYPATVINSTKYTTALHMDEFNNLYAIEADLIDDKYRLYKYANGSTTSTEFYAGPFSSGYPNLAYGITVYNKMVYAIDGDNGASGSRLLKLSPIDVIPPAISTGLVSTVDGGDKITLTWNSNSEADLNGYRVYIGTTNNPTELKASVPKVSGSSTTTQISGLTPGTTYYFSVSAVDGSFNEGLKSTAVSVVPMNPNISSATYNASTGFLVVSGNYFFSLAGADNDIKADKFTITGDGGDTYDLTTNTSNVDITSSTSFTLALGNNDRNALTKIINKNGTSSTSGTTYNIAVAEDWNAGADPALVIADLTNNGITVSNIAVPTITSATYDANTGKLVATGTGLLKLYGASNDISTSKLTLIGEGGITYTLTSANVEITSPTAFTIDLDPTQKALVNTILNKNGTSSTGGTTYNLAAAEDWNAGADAAVVIADLTSNSITVSNVAVPTITSAKYDANTGKLVITGANLSKLTGAINDISTSKLSLIGQGGVSYTLTSTDVEITSSTEFTINLSITDKNALIVILNKNGTSSTGGTNYNLAAANGWAPGYSGSTSSADLTGNGITVDNYSGVLPVTLTSFAHTKSNNEITLLWATSSEVNSGTFLLYKSVDEGKTYNTIANIKAAGNSNSLQKYTFSDKNPFNGTAYYKLVQVDQNGTPSLEKILAASFSLNNNNVVIYPNPTLNEIRFNDNRFKKATLTDVNGKKIASYTLISGSNTLNVATLAKGIYVLTLAGDKDVVIKKIIKN